MIVDEFKLKLMKHQFKHLNGKIKIERVIKDYMDLDRDGNAICPFHFPETRTFMVNKSKNVWVCTICNAGGDSIHFISLMQKCSNTEAMKRMIRRFNLYLPHYLPESEGSMGDLHMK